jgi:hypothetical protein
VTGDAAQFSFGQTRPFDRGSEVAFAQRLHDHEQWSEPAALHDRTTAPTRPNTTEATTPESRVLDLVQRDEGRPLEPATRAFAEPRFGLDFANIHIHDDGDAARAADAMDAQAVTVGSDILLNRGLHAPDSVGERSVLTHELAHAAQNQSSHGDTAHRSSGLAVRSSPEDSAELDARRAASSVARGGNAHVSSAPRALIAADPKTSDVDPEDAQKADAEDWKFMHSDVDIGATTKEKKGMAKSMAEHPTGALAREQSLADEGGLRELSLYDTTRKEGGHGIKEFEKAYGVFRLPLQMTMDSLGRTQDLLTAGAPEEPDKMSKDSRQIFHKLSGDQKGSMEKIAFGAWSRDTDELHHAVDSYVAVFTQLQGALLSWREVKELITIRQKKAQIANKTKDLEKLEAPAKLISGMIEVFESGVSAYEMFKPKAAAEEAADAEMDVHTMGQKTAHAGHEVKEYAEKGAKLGGFSKESIINWALGRSDEIAGLKAAIAQLKADIDAAGERAEDFKIEAAERQLEGISQENRAASFHVGSERTRTRESAGTFAGVMGGNNVDAHLVTLCAEAYQELRMNGEKTLEAYHPVAATLPAVQKFVNQPGHRNEIEIVRQHQRAARESGDIEGEMMNQSDYQDLFDAAKEAKTYGDLIKKELPQWQKRAHEWEAFFQKETGSRLDEYGAEKEKAG